MTAVEFVFDAVYRDMPYPELLGILAEAKNIEKQQQAYSEEDLRTAHLMGANFAYGRKEAIKNDRIQHFDNWFEQFKKK